MLPATTKRASNQTGSAINQRIRDEAVARIAHLARHPDGIGQRLKELDREWDLERALEANASVLAFTGTLLGASVDRRWLALPMGVTAFLFQHAIQGWCPPLPILRRLGIRTSSEIAAERYALKALRGDFAAVSRDSPEAAMRAAEV